MTRRLEHPLWSQMTPDERDWLRAFDRWHERGERTFVARLASVEARRIVDAQRWGARSDITKHAARAEGLALEQLEGPGDSARRSPVVEALTQRLRALTPGSGRAKAPAPTPEAQALCQALTHIARWT